MNGLLLLPEKETLTLFYQITISIAGILLPVFQAVLFFVIEKSFSKFEHSRQQLIKFFRLAGKLVSASLLLLILLPLAELLNYPMLSMLVILVFSIYFVVFRFALLFETGLWTTMNSTKFIPSNYSKVRKFFRTCKNNNLGEWLNFILWVAVLIAMPFYLYADSDFNYTPNLAFYMVFCNLIYVLLTVNSLLNNPTEIQQQVLQSEHKLEVEEEKWDKSKIDSESNLIKKQITNSKVFSSSTIKEPRNHFEYFVRPEVKENGLVHCNILVQDIEISSVEELKESIAELSRSMLIEFLSWRTDVNKIVLSWHLKLDNKPKNLFIRTDKDEVATLKDINQGVGFIAKLKNTVIDDVLS